MSSLRKEILARKGLPSVSEEGSSTATGVVPSTSRGLRRSGMIDVTPLEWNEFFDRKLSLNINDGVFCVYTKGDIGPIFYMLHGGGYSGLTWAALTEKLSSQLRCRIVAPDLRGHGDTVTTDELDLSTERQTEDIVAIHKNICAGEATPTFIIGHSMGGALSVHVAASGRIKHVIGIAVIDVVEGTAMEALNTMKHFLKSRPQKFGSVGAAVEWCCKSGTAKNSRAARVSMPAQIKKTGDLYTWRIDLSKTEPHWVGWFKGLSKLFLSCRVPKLLVLAGIDRLDTDLIVGQMQGKFQETILPKAGHAVQEDSPDDLADTLASFAIRNRICHSVQ
ncbi:phosphatase methylesterase 1 [Loa loa]|nr:phosphatase methylesterase 1 [Loa loa]EFO22152.1 phosphatase methylesterase 1 [Loa loa]